MAERDENSVPPGADLDPLNDEELQRLMREAFQDKRSTAQVDVLGGVQQRLRDRSQGKFYADAWSTERHPPFATYFITSLMMLAVVMIIYAVLTPFVGEPVELPEDSPPVQVIPRATPKK